MIDPAHFNDSMRKETMKKSLIFGFAIAAVSLGILDSAEAATANFQGKCYWGETGTHPNKPLVCKFDAQRPTSDPSSCSPSSIDNYFWDYNDGITDFGPVASVDHTFQGPHSSAGHDVYLAVFCTNGSTATKLRHINIAVGVWGGIHINNKWN